jgi:hypothetical protein
MSIQSKRVLFGAAEPILDFGVLASKYRSHPLGPLLLKYRLLVLYSVGSAMAMGIVGKSFASLATLVDATVVGSLDSCNYSYSAVMSLLHVCTPYYSINIGSLLGMYPCCLL